ncbi:MAG: nicotinate (nicotinamide) nucleotide adenylyltransferase [Spirochaetaceae bacterium]|jgi:nicotinate-nucleotide adenylyltransferase|nr:nicotinate (nicotinamide) nucleotide adenylyltransferase [Spirochaetaceae bacterium]
MKFAILGGSFNPVHKGHLKLAASVYELGYDRVILIPAYQSPLKPSGQAESAKERAEMLLAAIGGDRRFTVDLCEIHRAGISYTVDTLRDITVRYTPEGKTGLVLGDDLVRGFSTWQGADEIAQKAEILIARRTGASPVFPFPHREMDNDIYELSSAQIRAAIAEGAAWRNFVPLRVGTLIARNGMYGCAPEPENHEPEKPSFTKGSDGQIEALETFVREKLSLFRFVHSRNVALHCADLAVRFGLDTDTAYRAGLLHDICKDLDDVAMITWAQQDGEPFTQTEQAKPALLHGRAGAEYIKWELNIHDTTILEAVRCHTTGYPGMGALAQIVYIADKIEAGRMTVDPALRLCAFGPNPIFNLEELYHTVHTATHIWLQERGII